MLRNLNYAPGIGASAAHSSKPLSRVVWPNLSRNLLVALLCLLICQGYGAIAYLTVDLDPPIPSNNEFSLQYQSEGFLERALEVAWSGAGKVALMGISNQTVLTLSNRSETVLGNLELRLGLARGDFVGALSDGAGVLVNQGHVTMIVPALLPSETRQVALSSIFPSAGDCALSFQAIQGGELNSILQLRGSFEFLIEPGAAAGVRPALSNVVSAAYAPRESQVWVQFQSISNCLYRFEPISAHLAPGICLDAPIHAWCVAEKGAVLYVVHTDPLRLRSIRMADGQVEGDYPLASPYAPEDTVVTLLGSIGVTPGSLLVRLESGGGNMPAVLRVYDQGIPRPTDAVLTDAIGVGAGEVRLNPDPTSEVVAFHFTETANRLDLIRLAADGVSVSRSFVSLPTTHRSVSQPREDFAISGPWVLFSSGLWLQWQDGTQRLKAAPAGGPLIARNHGTQLLMIPTGGVELVASEIPSGDSDWALRYSFPVNGLAVPQPRFFVAGDETLCVLHERPGKLSFINDLPPGPASADLRLTLGTDRKSRSPSDVFKLSWTIDNRKGWDVAGFEINVVVPPGVRWVPVSQPNSPLAYQLLGDRLIGRYSGRVREKAVVNDSLYFEPTELGASFTFTASVSAVVPDPVPENNTRSLEVPSPSLPQVVLRTRRIQEGDVAHQEPASFVTLGVAGMASLPVEMDLVAVDGTAIAGQDYLFPPQKASFKPGVLDAYSVSLKLDLTVLGNTRSEPDRTFYLRVLSITNAMALSDLIAVRIVDDDPRPELRIRSIRREGSVMVIDFFTILGVGYVVEQAGDLASPQWSVKSGPISGNGSVIRVQIPSEVDQPRAFLRIREN